MWGWLSGIVGGLETVWEAVTSLPSLIADKLKGFFTEVKDAILGLPTAILDGIKGIFIPDKEYIDTVFDDFLTELKMKFGFDTAFFETLFQNESVVSDVDGNYTIPYVGTFNLKFLDTSYLVEGVSFFRPFVRGWLVLMMMLYHIRQLIGFFGYDAGVVAGRTDEIKQNRENQRGG